MEINPTGKYHVMPPLSKDEYGALRADIEAIGILSPVLVDETGDVIDGHNRWQITQELVRQ
jgi:ParB-like chromosome segregation protein Spo0J